MMKRGLEIEGNTLERYWGAAKTVSVPRGVEVIRTEAFRDNRKVRKITLPKGLREIRIAAFRDCGNLTDLRLPDSLLSLGREAFAGCRSLRNIRIPPRITELPANLFEDCAELECVELSEGLLRISDRAFENCGSLEKLALPSTLESVAPSAFHGCGNLSSLSIPLLNPGLDLSPLFRLPLRYLELPQVPVDQLPSHLRYAAVLGLANWETRGNSLSPELEAPLVSYLTSEWPAFQKEAERNLPLLMCFLRRKILSRESVDVLLERLSGPEHAETVAMLLDYQGRLPAPAPDELLNRLLRELETGFLSPAAFDASWASDRDKEGHLVVLRYLGNGGDLTVPAGRGEEPVCGIGDSCFYDRQDIRSVVIPEGVSELGGSLFLNCRELRRVEFPSTVTAIPWSAFEGCVSLTEVRLGPGLRRIEDRAFMACSRLEELDLPEGLQTISAGAFCDCPKLSRISLPCSLKETGSEAFHSCASLTSLRIPAAVKEIGWGAFAECSSLRNLEVDPANPYWRMEGPFLLSGDGTVLLTVLPNTQDELVVPDGVREISDMAFSSLTRPVPITIPASVTSIRTLAFFDAAEELTFLGVPRDTLWPFLCRYTLPKRIRILRESPDGAFHQWLENMKEDGCVVEILPPSEPDANSTDETP